jgi:adenine-specific DNA-methyltransferase
MNNTNNTMNTTDLGYSPDALAQRRAELLALLSQTAPEVLSDHQQINVDKLKALLGEEHTAGDEHYELSWAGKSAARREIQKTSSHTLLPDANNPAQAQHMLIEGENLEVLRVLQKSYFGKVKMIYIDPPYNTGNDSFVYPDDYSETLEEYQKRTGEKNEAGYLNKQSLWKKNSKESGQYHSAWLSMMYPRLYLARNLLRDDGVIFISIDDNEAANLKLLCDEVFGAENFVAQLIWEKGRKNDAKLVSIGHEYMFVYSKNKSYLKSKNIKWREAKPGAKDIYNEYLKLREKYGKDNLLVENGIKAFYESLAKNHPSKKHSRYNKVDDRGIWRDDNMSWPGGGGPSYDVVHPVTKIPCVVPDGGWRYGTIEKMNEMIHLGKVVFRDDHTEPPIRKTYLVELDVREESDDISDEDGDDLPIQVAGTYFYRSALQASSELNNLFGRKIFDYPKDRETLSRWISYVNVSADDIVLDFFAGSGTTTHAVMELNVEDGGNRQSISVQLPEVLDKASEAYKAGYRTIADITRARIDKVIAKLKAEHPDKTADLACAHFTLAPSNFKVWRGDVNDAQALRDQLALFQSAEKTGQAPQAVDAQTAMLTELLLKHGLGALGVHAISRPLKVAGVTVHRVLAHDDKHMWLCFEPYTEALKDEIVRARPAQVVMLNSCFVGAKADEQLSNLQLELAGLDIGLTVI